MTTKKAWEDRDNFIKLFKNLHNYCKHFNENFIDLETFKNEVLDDPTRKAEMKKLIDEDPDWTLTKIQDKYNEFKSIFDFLEQL